MSDKHILLHRNRHLTQIVWVFETTFLKQMNNSLSKTWQLSLGFVVGLYKTEKREGVDLKSKEKGNWKNFFRTGKKK